MWWMSGAWAAPLVDVTSALPAADVGGLSDGLHGVAWLDADGDGDLDWFHPNGFGMPARLFRNDGGAFVEVAAEVGAAVRLGNAGALAVDVDGDGWTDLVLPGDGSGSFASTSPLRVLKNESGRFRDATAELGLLALPMGSIAASAADVDADGDIDLFVAFAGVWNRDRGERSRLLLQQDGVFVDGSAAAGILDDPWACSTAFVHLDDDDAIDLVVGRCFGTTPYRLSVYRNLGGGRFAQVAEAQHVWAEGYWMGLATGDLDEDGVTDVFSTSTGQRAGLPHALYRGLHEDFEDVSVPSHAPIRRFAWGAALQDFDNDGALDVFLAGGGGPHFLGADEDMAPATFARGRGDGTFAPAEFVEGPPERTMSGVAAADYDGDGAVDLAIGVQGSAKGHGQPILLRGRGGGASVTVRLRDPSGANPAAIGARVTLRTASGRTLARQVLAGDSFSSTSSPWPTFGLGEDASAEASVRWPGGERERFGVVGVGVVELERGRGIVEAPSPGSRPEPVGCAVGGGARGGLAALAALAALRRRRA